MMDSRWEDWTRITPTRMTASFVRDGVGSAFHWVWCLLDQAPGFIVMKHLDQPQPQPWVLNSRLWTLHGVWCWSWEARL